MLLYGRNSAVVTGDMLKVQEVLLHQSAIQIMGMTAQHTMRVEWECPLVADALDNARLLTIKECIQHRQATIAVQVACRSIYEIFKESKRMPGANRFLR